MGAQLWQALRRAKRERLTRARRLNDDELAGMAARLNEHYSSLGSLLYV